MPCDYIWVRCYSSNKDLLCEVECIQSIFLQKKVVVLASQIICESERVWIDGEGVVNWGVRIIQLLYATLWGACFKRRQDKSLKHIIVL